MEQEMLKQILAMLNGFTTRFDRVETRLDRIEAQQAKDSARLDRIEAQQAKDSHLLNVVFENSIDLTERITGHDLVFDALQGVLQERNQTGVAS